jgi:hypothetical protein
MSAPEAQLDTVVPPTVLERLREARETRARIAKTVLGRLILPPEPERCPHCRQPWHRYGSGT